MEVSKRIKIIRIEKGLSQAEIEKRTGIKREYLSKIENGHLSNPTFDTIKKLSEVGFDISLLEFFMYPCNDGENNLREKRNSKKRRINDLNREIKETETAITEKSDILLVLFQEKQFLLKYLGNIT